MNIRWTSGFLLCGDKESINKEDVSSAGLQGGSYWEMERESLTDENLKGKGSEVRICMWCWGEDTFLLSAWLGSDVMMDFSDSGALLYPLSPVWLLTHFLTRPLASVYSLCFESQLPTFEFLHLPSSPDSQRNSPIFHCLWYLNFFLVPFFHSDHQSYKLGSYIWLFMMP